MIEQAVRIEIYSDVVCPWCYVGKRRLERALKQMKGARDAAVTWRPFQLNPTMPKEGMERTAYLEAKFGSLEAFHELEEQVLAAGQAEQIAFAFDKIARTPNTLLAHRLIWYSATEGRQDAVVEALFHGYFQEGADIGSLSTLMTLADRAGLKPETAERVLMSDEGEAAVKADEKEGHRLGIRGVPYFVLNRTYGISGAQPAEVLVSAIEKVRAQSSLASLDQTGER